MIRFAAAAIAVLVTGGPDTSPPPESPWPIEQTIQVAVRQRIIIRVPRGEPRTPAMNATPRWRETNGPRCIPAHQIAGAMPAGDTIDLVMRDNRRFRAHFRQRCQGLDYYRGVYVDAHPDGQICATRDAIRSRMGGHCAITQFRQLHPARR